MSQFWQTISPWAGEWIENLWRASWQGAIVLAVAWAIARWCSFLSPRIVCWTWRLACLKLLVALIWAQPIALALLPAAPPAPRPGPTFANFAAAPQVIPHQAAMDAGELAALAPAAAPEIPLLPLVVCSLWLIGFVACVALTLRQWRSATGLLRSAEAVTEERLLAMCREEAIRLSIRRWPRLRSAARIESPLLIGVGRPAIILPEQASTKFDESELRLMIAHELAHLGRHDLAWNWLPTLARCLFFFHPLVWVMLRCWSEAQEAACDELLIQRRVAGPADYGRMLLKLSARSAVEPQAPLVAAGVLGAYRNLERRILSMARVRPFSARRLILAAGVLLLAAPLALVPWQLVAQEPKESTESAPVFAESESGGKRAKRNFEVTPAVQQVLDRLQEVGADPLAPDQVGISINFKGTDADVKLLEQLPALDRVWLDLTVVSPEAVSGLQLARELEKLEIIRPTDESLAKIARLPKCRHLSVSMFPQPLSAAGCRTLARLAAGIESLVLWGDPNAGGIDNEGLKAICQIESLSDLSISPGKITDEGLAPLVGLKKLNHLELNYCLGVRGPGYAHLAPIESLRRLDIKMAWIDGAGFKALGGLGQLEEMSLDLNDFPAASLKTADVAELKNMTHLQSLRISSGESDTKTNPAIGNAILIAAGQMPALKSLDVVGISDINADGLETLAKSPHLERLSLSVSLDPRGAADLGQMAALQELALYGTGPIKVEVAANLAKCKSLAELLIDNLSDDSLRELAPLHTLETLYVQKSEVTGTGPGGLAELTHLKTLKLGDSPFGDQGSQALRKLPELETLNLSKTKITDRALDDIATLANLRELNLDDTAITAEGLLKLRGLKQLRMLSVAGTKASKADLAGLRAALPDVEIHTVEFGAYSLQMQPAHLDAAAGEPEPAFSFQGGTLTVIAGPAELEKQAAEIEQKIADGKATDEDLRTLAPTLAFIRGDAKSLDRAIRMYEQLSAKEALAARDRMTLARMYEKAGKWPQARDELKTAVAEDPADFGVLVTLIQLLLRHDDTEGLGPLMEQLEAVAHGGPAIWQFKIRWLAKQGKTDEAVKFLESRIPDPVKRADISLVTLIAALLEELKQNDAAEKLMREVYAKDPSQTVALASFLGRIGKLDESLALYEKARKTEPLVGISPAMLQTLRLNSASVTPKQRMTVLESIRSAIEQDPESLPLQFALVDFLDLIGQYQESMSLYRKLLARPDLNDFQRAAAENNLAYLLVTRGKPGDLTEAEKLVDDAVKQLGPVAGALDTRGLVRLAQGNLKGALDDFKAAVAEGPDQRPSALNFFHLALAQEKVGDEAAAVEAFQRALALRLDTRQLPPDHLQSYQRLEQLLAKPGKS